MSCKDRISAEVKQAQKAGDAKRRDTLRLLLSVIHNEEIEVRAKEKRELNEEDIIRLLQKEGKKRKESIEAYREGKRGDLAIKEEEELKIIEEYLPEMMSLEEVEGLVRKTIEGIQPEHQKDFGRVMGEVIKKAANRADGALVKRLVESCMREKAVQ